MKYIYTLLIALIVLSACEDNRDLSFVDAITLPTNILATYNISQDNTGTVVITPTADGATKFKIYLGDGTSDPVMLDAGESIEHVYTEGVYTLKIEAYNLTGDKAEATQELVVSFKAPENLMVTILNNDAISKQVEVMATADYATMYEFYSGETGVTQPVATANIGESISYQYQNSGIYEVKIIAKGAAITTTEYIESFEVTEILQPIVSAPTPPIREVSDIISIYGSAYTNIVGTDTFPDWGQGGQGSSWTEFDLNGDKMLQYINLSYQGIQIGTAQDVSNMEYLHLDVWTKDVTVLETSLINISVGVATEKPVNSNLTSGEWTSLDIPIADYVSQGLTVSEILQLKFVGTPWAAGTVFIDNIYFWKSPSDNSSQLIQDFEGTAPIFTSFGGAGAGVVSNPDISGKNRSANVVKLSKSSGSETWAGAFFEVSPLDLVTYSKIGVKVWSPKNGVIVKLKLENADASITHEIDVNTTAVNEWEELMYDFSGAPAASYVKVVLFFDFGNAGDNSDYYYDDITLLSDVITSSIFENFEGTAPTFTSFGNIAGIISVDNPDATGTNISSKVAKMIKTDNSETWAGAFFEVSSLDLSTYSKISVKSWSPKQAIVVKLKLENADGSITHEVDVVNTVTNSWELLTYDFSGAPVADYVKVVVFFDFGNAGDGSSYYFDEFTLTN